MDIKISLNWLWAGLVVVALFAPVPASAQSGTGVVLLNLGGSMGGHTPRGFQGQGNGIFVGDNLNARFPNGDGVQAFISFDLSELADTDVTSAALSSAFLRVNGSPFTDLGQIRLERVEFFSFSSAIWDIAADADSGCVLRISANQTRAECDLTKPVQSAIAKGAETLQFRLRFDKISDSDGQQDLAQFYKRQVNENEGGVFTLILR